MEKRSVFKGVVLGSVLLVALPSCETTEEQGAALGGLIAGIACAIAEIDPGACVGMVTAGAMVGAVAGGYVESEKKKYANLEEFYQKEMALAEDYNVKLSQYQSKVTEEISLAEAEVGRLVAQKSSGQAVVARIEAERQQIESLSGNLNSRVSQAKEELEKRNEVLADIRNNGTNYSEQAQRMQTEIARLETSINTLETQTAQVASIGNRIQ